MTCPEGFGPQRTKQREKKYCRGMYFMVSEKTYWDLRKAAEKLGVNYTTVFREILEAALEDALRDD